MVAHFQQDVQEHYDVGDKAGEGTQGVVFRATRKRTGVLRAVKKVPKHGLNPTAFRREIEIMKSMDHPNIIKLYETFDDRLCYYLVMELCDGGELFDKIVEEGGLREQSAAIVLQQILRAVHYMHGHNIAHRDLKPENFLFMNRSHIDEDNLLKLIDFGIACECGPNTTLKEPVGTPYYMAPQVVAKRYDKSCDIWSCGVIMFALLSGSLPFNAPSDHAILAKVREGIVRCSGPEWAKVSDNAKHLVRQLLTRNPRDRCSAQQALEHVWILNHAPGAEAELNFELVEQLGCFRRKNRMKQAALTIVASEMNETQIRSLRETFVALDLNGDGLLTYHDIQAGMAKAGLDVPEDALMRFKEDMDSVMDYTEFIASTLDLRKHVSEQAIRVAFAMFDTDGCGKISTQDVARVFAKSSVGGAPQLGVAAGIVKKYAKRGKDGMDFEDFRRMISHDESPADVVLTPSPPPVQPASSQRFGLPVAEA